MATSNLRDSLRSTRDFRRSFGFFRVLLEISSLQVAGAFYCSLMTDQNLCEAWWAGGAMNEQISAWVQRERDASFIQNSRRSLINRELTKMSANIGQFSYVAKLVALTYQYVELNLTLSDAVRAAEADLRQRHQV
jgi:hypothetical protein